ncbi:MAG: DNA polymerase III subunit delta [Microthrixaceae bacterium]
MPTPTAVHSPLYLLKGSDEILLGTAASELVTRLIGSGDRTELLDSFTGDEYLMSKVIMAATTMSMFGSRVVLARNCARFSSEELEPLLSYLENPAPDSTLVLIWEKAVAPGTRTSPLPKKLSQAIKDAGGEIHDCGLPGGKGRSMWVEDQLAASRVCLNSAARRVLIEQLGEDLSRLAGVLKVLEATFGTQEIGPEEIEPYLGSPGAVPPWELTDAIDGGRVAEAVEKLQRLLAGGDRHPLQVMVSLQTHVERMLRLDGSGVRDEKQAAALLGMKGSTFPAKKALTQSRKLGTEKLIRSIKLVAAADVDLRGRTDQSGELLLETLVARLTQLSAPAKKRR